MPITSLIHLQMKKPPCFLSLFEKQLHFRTLTLILQVDCRRSGNKPSFLERESHMWSESTPTHKNTNIILDRKIYYHCEHSKHLSIFSIAFLLLNDLVTRSWAKPLNHSCNKWLLYLYNILNPSGGKLPGCLIHRFDSGHTKMRTPLVHGRGDWERNPPFVGQPRGMWTIGC